MTKHNDTRLMSLHRCLLCTPTLLVFWTLGSKTQHPEHACAADLCPDMLVPWHGQDSCSTSEGVLECTPCSINYMFYIKYLHLYLWHNGSLHVPEKARFTSTESLTHSPPVKMPDRSQPASGTALAIAPFLSSSRVRHKKQKTRPCQHHLQELVPSWGMDVLPFSV